MARISNTKKLGVVSFTGLNGTGKSTIANMVHHCLHEREISSEIFKVGHGTRSTTRGLHCAVLEKEEDVFIILDLEGLYGNIPDIGNEM